MKHTELRQFLKEANELGLSPIEKDVFQYYYSCTQNDEGEWYCPDTETAEDIRRSRNGVCAARQQLIACGWITVRDHFHIKVVKTFSSPVRFRTGDEKTVETPEIPVSFQTESEDVQSETGLDSPKSDSTVRNQTESPESSVRNQTPLIPYKGNLGIEVNEEEKQEHKAREPVSSSPPSVNNFSKRENLGIPVTEILGEMPETFGEYQQITTQKLLEALKVKSLRDKSKIAWETEMKWAFENDYSPDEFIECFEVLKRQPWRESRVSPESVGENLPFLSHLKLKELEEKTPDIVRSDGKDRKQPRWQDVGKFEPTDGETFIVRPLTDEERGQELDRYKLLIAGGNSEFVLRNLKNFGEIEYAAKDFRWLVEEVEKIAHLTEQV